MTSASPWTDLPSGLTLHGVVRLAGLVRVTRKPEPLVETTLPPADAEALARALTDAGHDVTLESRLRPHDGGARLTLLRLGTRLAVPTDPARLVVEGAFELGREARFVGDVEAACAQLDAASVLEGDLAATQDVDIGEGARVQGRVACQRSLRVATRGRVERGVEARSLRLEPGAIVQGHVRARASVATPPPSMGGGAGLSVPDDAVFAGELRLRGPVVVRASGHVPIHRGDEPVPVLRVEGDVRVEPGAKVPFALEATGAIDVLPGAQLLAHASAARGLRVAGRSGEEAVRREPRSRIAIELERALDL